MKVLALIAAFLGLARSFVDGKEATLHESYSVFGERLNVSATVGIDTSPLPGADTSHESPATVVESLFVEAAEVQTGAPVTRYYSWELEGEKPGNDNEPATPAQWSNLTITLEKL